MKKVAIVFMLVGLSIPVLAQDQSQNKVQNPAQQQAFSAAALYSTTYQRALRYNDYNVAKAALYNLVSMFPQNDSLLYSLSVLYFQAQQYASAALTARDVLTLNPDNSGALEISAISFQQIGAKDKAIESYEKLYMLTQDYEYLYQLSFLQYELGRLNESLTNVNILMDKKETQELTVTFATANNEQKDYPIRAALFNLKGLILKDQEKKQEAMDAFNKALEIAPDFQPAKENLSSVK